MPTPTLILAVVAAALAVAAWVGLRSRQPVRVNDWQRAAVYVDGVFETLLPPGRHVLWRRGGKVTVSHIELTPTHAALPPVDVVTADRLPLRLQATVVFRIDDAEGSLREPVWPQIQLAAQVALARLGGQASLEDLLAHDGTLDAALTQALGDRIGAAVIEKAVVTGVVLPPELRRLLSEVERSRLEGLAALERARGEQASLRALANAARLLKDNPELAQLRLLQTVETAKGATVVLGDGAPAIRK